MHQVARDLEKHLVCYQAEPVDRKVRTRLVAFGRSPVNDLHTISLTHVFETMIGQFEEYGDALRAAQFKNPAAALIRLLVKTGFEIKKDPRPGAGVRARHDGDDPPIGRGSLEPGPGRLPPAPGDRR